jgi:hypothetical protein
VVINDFHVMSVTLPPQGTDSKAVVDAEAGLPSAISLESFQPVARRSSQVFQGRRKVQLASFRKATDCKSAGSLRLCPVLQNSAVKRSLKLAIVPHNDLR